MSFLSIAEARSRILTAVRDGERAPLIERVLLDDALGRVLAADLPSPIDWPRFDNSAMDGYAVRWTALESLASGGESVRLPVVAEVLAGSVAAAPVPEGAAARIMTGAPVPTGCDTVVPREDTDESDPDAVVIHAAPRGRGAHIRKQGENLRHGHPALHGGTVLDPGAIGLLASFSRSRVEVCARPRVAILSTGDELVEVDTYPVPEGHIVNSSSFMLAAQLRAAGAVPIVCPIVPDTRDAVERAFDRALSSADLVISIGGVSVGDADLVREVIADRSAGEVGFWKVSMKPGKPLAFGLVGKTPLLGLPGNPVSSAVTFEVFGRPLVRALAGVRDDRVLPERIRARLTRAMRGPKWRPELVRGRVGRDGEGASTFTPLASQGSGDLTSVVDVDGVAEIPANTSLERGATVEVELFRQI